MQILALGIIFFSLSLQAKTTWDIYADCSNYCAFRELENNCHGIAFKQKKNGEVKFLDTNYSRSSDSCVHNTLTINKSISIDKVKSLCSCKHLPPVSLITNLTEPIKESSLEELKVLKNKILTWAPCAPDPLSLPVPKNDQVPYGPKDLKSCQELKKSGKDYYGVLGGCFEGTKYNFCNYYGNTNAFLGPICFAGETDRCNDIAKNQDPKTGAWYRNAYLRRFVLAGKGQPVFSRDEELGIMLYFAKTKDKVAAEKWMRFVATNPKKYLLDKKWLGKVHNICPPLPDKKPDHLTDDEWKSLQPDERCEMRPDNWGTMYKVYRYIGFSDHDLKKISYEIFKNMKRYEHLTYVIGNVSVRTVPRFSYEMGDQAATVLLLTGISKKVHPILKNSAKWINHRTDYDSPYYHFLGNQWKATEYGAHLIKKLCPAKQPDYVNPPQGGIGVPAAGYLDSAVHWFNGLRWGIQANLPTGHECLAWIDLYLNAAKKNE